MTALAPIIHKLKNEFFARWGKDPNMLLVPRRRDHVKLFSEAVAADTQGEAGSAPYIFDQLWRENRQCYFCGLEVFLSEEVDDLEVDFNIAGDEEYPAAPN